MNRTCCTVLGCIVLVLFIGTTGCTSLSGREAAPVARGAEDVRPLDVGRNVPSARIYTMEGKPADIRNLVRRQPTVLIFYRGGWCPYCSTHLGELGAVQEDLRDLGYQIIAVSPDRPKYLRSAEKEEDYGYTLMSDHEANAIRAFGLAFRVADETFQNYRSKGLNLEKRSGRDHHILPVPAAYVVDENGVIRFAYWNPDYKQRIDVDKLLQAARRVKK